MKKKLVLPSTLPGMPWAKRPISLPTYLTHSSRYSGIMRRSRYASLSPVSPSNTAPATSHNNFIGNFKGANCLGMVGVSVIYMHNSNSMTSCVSVRLSSQPALVFLASLIYRKINLKNITRNNHQEHCCSHPPPSPPITDWNKRNRSKIKSLQYNISYQSPGPPHIGVLLHKDLNSATFEAIRLQTLQELNLSTVQTIPTSTFHTGRHNFTT